MQCASTGPILYRAPKLSEIKQRLTSRPGDDLRKASGSPQGPQKLSTEWLTPNILSTAQMMAWGPSWGSRRVERWEPERLVAFAAEHRAALEFAERITGRKTRIFCSTPVQAVYARAYYHMPEAMIRSFSKTLINQIPAKGCWISKPALSLAKYLLKRPRISSVADRIKLYRRVQQSLHWFWRGKDYNRTICTAEDLFPIVSSYPTAA